MTSSKIGNDERREVPIVELLAVFFVIDRLTVRFFSGRRWSQEPSFKPKMPFGGRAAHAKTESGYVVCFSHNPAPLSAKGWSNFRLHNRGIFRVIYRLLVTRPADHENRCFIEHPRQAHAHTLSGLRAGNPTHRKSSPTHPRASASPFPRRLRTQ